MKTCAKCGEDKPLVEFHLHGPSRDGRKARCKECRKEETRLRYMKNKEKILDQTRKWSSANRERVNRASLRWARANPKKRIESIRKWKQGNPDSVRRYVRESAARYPDKVKARRAVKTAIDAGRLIRGDCSWCGATENVQGHHWDYNKPLEVQWLCASCHGTAHRIIENGIES